MKEHLDDYSTREKNLWFELLVDLAVALYYWPQAIRLMLAGDEALTGGAMVNLVIGTVMCAIFVATALSVFLHVQRKPEPMDERDYMIAARASLLAGRVLVAGVVVIMGHAAMQEMAGSWAARSPLPTFTPLLMAHLLLVVLMLWSFTGTIARLYYYRKGM